MSDKTTLLSEMKIGQHGKILELDEESPTTQRIEEMGVTPGENIEVVRLAPMGDPMEIKVRGYLLSLRRDEAQNIKVSVGDIA